ncbi:MAG: DUF4401 domain-containing protein, partial [Chloroflexota bacterium]
WREMIAQDIRENSRVGLAVFAFIVIFAFPSFLAPGLMAGLLVVLMGFRNQNAALLTLGYLSLVGFLGEFYYSLDTTLLVKSLIMFGSGVVMLGGWAVVRRNLGKLPDDAVTATKGKSQGSATA